MEAKIGKFFDDIGSFFGGGDQIPWCDRDIIVVSFLHFQSWVLGFFGSQILGFKFNLLIWYVHEFMYCFYLWGLSIWMRKRERVLDC